MTDDELTILTIASHGNSMLAIGRWKPAVESLNQLGLLRKLDPFNYVITEQGKKILEVKGKQDDEQFQQAYGEYAQTENHRTQMLQSAEQAAIHLSHAARASVRLTGRPANQIAWEIAQSVLMRTLELLEGTHSDRPN